MQGAAISWTSKGQETVSLSTAESEYKSMVLECIWLHRLTNEVRPQPTGPLTLHCDNKSALQLALNGSASSSPRTKHLEIDDKFIREHLEKGTFTLKYIETKNMIADIMTKPMTSGNQTKFTFELGII